MPTLHGLSSFDLLIVSLCAFFFARGVWVGCARQLAVFCALACGYSLAGQYGHRVLPWTERFFDHPKVIFLVGFAMLFLAAAFVFTLLGKVLLRVVRIVLHGWLDRFLGLILGGVKAGAIASLLYMLLASSLSATNDMLRKSVTTPYLRQGAELLRSCIDDPRLRASFAQKEPAILNDLSPGAPPEKKTGQAKPGQR